MSRTIQSLGLRTELMIASWHAEITDHDGWIVVRTPSNPSYHWGNYVIFKTQPDKSSLSGWVDVFRQAITNQQPTMHTLLLWDDVSEHPGDVSAFIEHGFELEPSIILTSRQVIPPPRPNADAVVRPLTTDEEWAQALENQIRCRDAVFTEENYRSFKVAQMKNYRALAEQGHGDWYGAFLGGELVADLGIYREGGLARYQSVGTHPDFRCQGLCGTLVYQAGVDVLRRHGVKHLVMIADPDAQASGIYQSVGFAIAEKMHALYRREASTPKK